MLIPTCYLSGSEGTFRVVYQGMPICNNKATAAEALAAADQMRVTVSNQMWDGDAGKFVSRA